MNICRQIGPVALACLAIFLRTSALGQQKLPTTEQFMSGIIACATNLHLDFGGDLEGSLKSFYEGVKTQGHFTSDAQTQFLSLFPESSRQDVYKLYAECILRLLSVNNSSTPSSYPLKDSHFDIKENGFGFFVVDITNVSLQRATLLSASLIFPLSSVQSFRGTVIDHSTMKTILFPLRIQPSPGGGKIILPPRETTSALLNTYGCDADGILMWQRIYDIFAAPKKGDIGSCELQLSISAAEDDGLLRKEDETISKSLDCAMIIIAVSKDKICRK